jgi:hypothetical protein
VETIGAPPAATLDAKALADRWHTSPGRLANMRASGEGPAYFRVGRRRVLYRASDVLAYEQENLVQSGLA